MGLQGAVESVVGWLVWHGGQGAHTTGAWRCVAPFSSVAFAPLAITNEGRTTKTGGEERNAPRKDESDRNHRDGGRAWDEGTSGRRIVVGSHICPEGPQEDGGITIEKRCQST